MLDYKLVLIPATKGLTDYQKSKLRECMRTILAGTESQTILVPMLGRGKVPAMDEAIKILTKLPTVKLQFAVFMREPTEDIAKWIDGADQVLAFPARSRQLGITSDRVWTVVRHLKKTGKAVTVVYPWAVGDLINGPVR